MTKTERVDYLISNVIVNRPTREHEYTGSETVNDMIATLATHHPDWTSMVITIVRKRT